LETPSDICAARQRHFPIAHLPVPLKAFLFELTLLGRQPDSQELADFFVQLPHLINRHGIQMNLFAHAQPSG
jgi:hypothetical protein